MCIHTSFFFRLTHAHILKGTWEAYKHMTLRRVNNGIHTLSHAHTHTLTHSICMHKSIGVLWVHLLRSNGAWAAGK